MTDLTGTAARPRRPGVPRTIVDAVPTILACLAEGAWISVVGGLVQEYALREPVLGIPHLAAFALAGAVVARRFGHRLGDRWPLVALGLIALSAGLGLLVATDARAELGSHGVVGVLPAIATNPAGLFAGLAVLRGLGHARQPLREDTLSRLFAGGVVAITFCAMAGSLVAEPFRGDFLSATLTAGLTFAVTSVLALALTRQTVAGPEARADWPRNPAWVGLLVILMGLIVIAAVPAATFAPRAVELAIAVLTGPLLVVGMIAGWTRNGARFLGIVIILGAILVVVSPGLREEGSTVGGGGVGPGTPGIEEPAASDQRLLVIGGGAVTVIAIAGILLLIRLWMRQTAVAAPDVDETREIDRGGPLEPRPARRRRLGPFRRGPTDAVAAYRRLVADLDANPVVRRNPAETPAEHARRLRAAGRAGLSLDLLAADYALVAFGGVPLSPREEQRAVWRWRRLRGSLARVPQRGPSAAPGPAGRRDVSEPDPASELPLEPE